MVLTLTLVVSRLLFLIATSSGVAIVTHVTFGLDVLLGNPRIPVSPEKKTKAPTTFHKYIKDISDAARISNRSSKIKDTGIFSLSRTEKLIFKRNPVVSNERKSKQKKIRSAKMQLAVRNYYSLSCLLCRLRINISVCSIMNILQQCQ